MIRDFFLGLISIVWIATEVQCQLPPPSIYLLERNWRVNDNAPVGSKIAQVHGSLNEGDGDIRYDLEVRQDFNTKKHPAKLPFTIDRHGNVYLNESLAGRAGENIYLYVTASAEGRLNAKTEVYVNILNSSAPKGGPLQGPGFLNIKNYNPRPPSIDINHPPPAIANNPPPLPKQPMFQPKTPSKNKPETTLLQPVKEVANNDLNIKNEGKEVTTKKASSTVDPEDVESTNNLSMGQAVKSPTDVATTIPIISVTLIFIVVGVIAIIFRKKIYLGKPKTSGDDTRKVSSSGVMRENSSVSLQQWRPRAFSNRYEPWEREGNHPQAGVQISEPIKNADRWEFPRHRLKFFNILGEGAFGQVWKCEATDIDAREGVTVVAVKTLKENANEKEKLDLISELQVMKMLEHHPNVVRLLGCCADKEPIFLIMEYITQGKLQSYLRNSRAERCYNNMHGQSKSLTSRDLTSFVYQVAKGMEFLSSNGIIHRDLAARNILISDDHTCKVADFGFARDVISSHIYERKSEGRLPIRWMAPESLYDNIFSVKSDVWSFGVLMWEVVTLGSTPYPGLSAAEVMKKVRDGYRLDKPEHCRRELYNIMYYCWDKDATQRPTFTECVELLEKLLLTETDYIQLERFPDHSYYNMVSLSGEKL